MLTDNRYWLSVHFRSVAEQVKQIIDVDESKDSNVHIERSKSGEPTLKIEHEGRLRYVHSKYNPLRDSDRLLKDYNMPIPVFFFGVGLGYHIESFIERYPSVRIVIYEPNEEVFIRFLQRVDLRTWNPNNVISIIVGGKVSLEKRVKEVMEQTNGKITTLSLPLYDDLYKKEKQVILQVMIDYLESKKTNLSVEVSFQRLWTTNAIKNAPTVLRTPNMLVDVEKAAFHNKPAIIVAAGPSLNEEIENLRCIKEEGRAYLFAVGSAINTLIANDIIPDAICSYDPQMHNERVVKVVREKNISDVPLIFGSSVGYETLERYPNDMYHMLTGQDTVIPSLVGEDYSYVNDAASIAVVTYQLLYELGCSPIILVGQNLGYLDGHRYAKGIDYGTGTEITEKQKKAILYTEDVEGNKLATNEGFNSMREQLELYIQQGKRLTINTTVGGARIKGTTYKRLSDLLREELKSKRITTKWSCKENSYDRVHILKSLRRLKGSLKENDKNIEEAFKVLGVLDKRLKLRKLQNMEELYGRFDQVVKRVQENKFYIHYVEPMIRVQFEQLRQVIEDIRYETNQLLKGETIIPAFHNYLIVVREHSQYAGSLFEEMEEEIRRIWE